VSTGGVGEVKKGRGGIRKKKQVHGGWLLGVKKAVQGYDKWGRNEKRTHQIRGGKEDLFKKKKTKYEGRGGK